MPREDQDDFEAILEELKREAYEHDALVLLSDFCLGCYTSEEDMFFNTNKNKFNTRILNIHNEALRGISEEHTSVLVLVCNFCDASGVDNSNLRQHLIRMSLEGVMTKLE